MNKLKNIKNWLLDKPWGFSATILAPFVVFYGAGFLYANRTAKNVGFKNLLDMIKQMR